MGSISDEREGNIDINANQPGLFKICWRGLDNIPKTLSFDVSIGEKIEKKVASTGNTMTLDTLIFLSPIFQKISTKLVER